MLIKQISVFLENKPGQLSEFADILRKHGIDMRALSMAETKDFGILRIIVDDPDNVESTYNANERVHGTSMASLIVHGDLNDGLRPLGRPVYVRPIMQPIPNDFRAPRREHIPDDVLLVDLIHRSVKRLFEGDGSEGPVAPSVRVINLSIGDPYRQFLQSMSPVARLLDWLSLTYGVLFIVSAGNQSDAIQLGISRTEFESSDPQEQETAVVKALFSDARNRKLLSPAESINGLTVGSVQYDSSHFGRSITDSTRFCSFCRARFQRSAVVIAERSSRILSSREAGSCTRKISALHGEIITS